MISIITAVHPSHVRFLPDAAESVRTQETAWEWVLQIDGAEMDLPLPSDPKIRVEANGDAMGVSVTRNRALVRSSGSHIFSLDADDKLAPGALGLLLEGMESEVGAHFAVGRCLDYFSDGQQIERFAKSKYEQGLLAKGQLERVWRETKNLHVQPGAVLYERQAILAQGGWPAITGMEDQDLLLSISAQHAGAYVDEPVYLYRQHSGQTVRTARFENDRELHRAWSDARLRARRALNGEDAEDIASLETPLPDAAEIAELTSPEWKQAQLKEVDTSDEVPPRTPCSLDLRVTRNGGHAERWVLGSRLEIEQINGRLPPTGNHNHEVLGAGWVSTPQLPGDARPDSVQFWDLELAAVEHDLEGIFRVAVGQLLPDDAFRELVDLAGGIVDTHMAWYDGYVPEVPSALRALDAAWFDVLLPSVNWRHNDCSADPVVHFWRARLIWAPTFMVTLWTASEGCADSQYKTWGLPDRGRLLDQSGDGSHALAAMLRAIVYHLEWSGRSVDDEMEAWEDDFLRLASQEGPLFIGPDLGRMQRHLAGLGRGISLNREAARTILRRMEVQPVPEDCARSLAQRAEALVKKCEVQRARLREEFNLLENAVSGQQFRLAQERASRDGAFQAAVGILAAMFVAPGLIAAFYGANVRGLPGLDERSGLWYMLFGAAGAGALSIIVILLVRLWAGRRRL